MVKYSTKCVTYSLYAVTRPQPSGLLLKICSAFTWRAHGRHSERKTIYYLSVRRVPDYAASATTVTSSAITVLFFFFHRAIARETPESQASWQNNGPRCELALAIEIILHPWHVAGVLGSRTFSYRGGMITLTIIRLAFALPQRRVNASSATLDFRHSGIYGSTLRLIRLMTSLFSDGRTLLGRKTISRGCDYRTS